jgi:hypothetical protein
MTGEKGKEAKWERLLLVVHFRRLNKPYLRRRPCFLVVFIEMFSWHDDLWSKRVAQAVVRLVNPCWD